MSERPETFVEKIRSIRLHQSHYIAIGIAAVIILWFASGLLTGKASPAETSVADQEAANVNIPRVQVIESDATMRQVSLTIRGRTAAKRAVEVRAETHGIVAELPVEKGMSVKKGDMLCRLELNARDAQLAEAKAHMEQRRLEYSASRQLAEKGHRAPTAVAASKAAYDAAAARLKQMQIEHEQTRVTAPFDGIFDDRPVEIGDLIRAGDVCGLLVELDPLLVIGQVSEDRVGDLVIGMPGMTRLVTGETAEGKIHFVAKTADPATRTFRVELEVPNPSFRMRSGVTAEIIIRSKEMAAHLIPSAILTLGDNGTVGVRTVDERGTVHFNPITPVEDTPKGLWIIGLPEKARIISVGQDFVREGQIVEAIRADQAEASL